MPVKKVATIKKTVAKKAPVKTEVELKPMLTKSEPQTKQTLSLTVPMLTLTGEKSGTLKLSQEVFGAPINKQLLTQAMRVYTNNLTGHFSNTKTRGEVEGSTRKIFQQKGTGRARHGGIRAPIFVGGGIALGPKSRKVILKLPHKMRKAALASALSAKVERGELMVINGLGDASGKTKEIKNLLKKLEKRSVLFVTDGKQENAFRAVRNLQKAHILPVGQINAFEILKYQTIVMEASAAKAIIGGKKDA